MSIAEVILPPTDFDFYEDKPEHWTSVFGFKGLFDQRDQQVINDLLVTRHTNILDWAEEQGLGSHAIVFDLDGSLDVVVYDAAEAMRPVVDRLFRPLLRVYFFCHDETEKNLAQNEELRGHNFTDVVVGYMGRGSHER